MFSTDDSWSPGFESQPAQLEQTFKLRLWLLLATLAFVAIATAVVLLIASTNLNSSRFGREDRSYGLIAAWALGITVALALVSLSTKQYLKIKEIIDKKGKVLKPEYQRTLLLRKKWFINIHLAAGIVGFAAACVHAYFFWRFRNVWLVLAIILFAWMVVVGIVLKWGHTPPMARRYVYLLHAQWIIVVLLIIVTIVGHAGF